MNIEIKKEVNLPFLKWAGGKRWLIDKYGDKFFSNPDRLIEPFVGSGAVYFGLSPKRAILCDKNADLINTYQAIKDDWQTVVKHLKIHDRNHSYEYYYKLRSQKNRSYAAKAAQFIYLNRTCWNGLYRVNRKGEFNVPMGSKTKVVMDTDDFEKISKQLTNAKLLSGDFTLAINQAKQGDFVFADPPYTVKHNNNGFVKYNEGLFSWDDQIRLRDSLQEAIKRGAKVLVTNAYHSSVRSLYQGMGEIMKLNRPSIIAANSSARGIYEEMVIKCY
ncbi:Dam family site-specific DNA-(adenine-N6)-methyltransferase [Leptospira yanagawae]|uniref:Site-specific DNA-methyltransferase (adenine-specific) n=1 Tax=Leptospira yanagawae TaxID=293069 RepID=A0ABY2LXV9_9LEPT|nr:Dam family site-specific DNA-(adenine-N6)-methyltransferase [Leptospira yanagawae]TGL17912.1 Dam family site-specific DNA-(adenine-N6)-methyltransferase [Leptospira yanagawae]